MNTEQHLDRRHEEAKTNPGAGSVPTIRDKTGRYNQRLVENFLKEKICACWHLTGIGPFVSLMRSDTRWGSILCNFPTFHELSPEMMTNLWFIAQQWDIETTRTQIGQAISEIRPVFATNKNVAVHQVLLKLKQELSSPANTTAVDTPAQEADPAQPQPQPQPTLPAGNSSTQPPEERVYVPPTNSVVSTLGAEVSAYFGQANMPPSAEVEESQAPPPANLNIPLGTPKAIYDELPDSFSRDALARLDKKISAASLLRDQFLAEHLGNQARKKEEELRTLEEEEAQVKQVDAALGHLEALEGECAEVFDQGEGGPGEAKRMLSALKRQVQRKTRKRSREYGEEREALQENIKRLKTKSQALQQEGESIKALRACPTGTMIISSRRCRQCFIVTCFLFQGRVANNFEACGDTRRLFSLWFDFSTH
ncbi:unnamed protein product [Clonostachys rosea]|uniref:Uncharacterized protein n=1 Tax=Bionectria ochroleuca TaxID=29856 RepID=A0ABY6UR85_BIOOC|nr:unnamed protein product [Clonostachys rosea]